jgi:nucleoid-associated protein YgaU
MTRETKIGLLVGLAFIIVIGILLSDHMTSTTEPPKAPLSVVGANVRESVVTPAAPNGAAPVAAGGQTQGTVAPSQPVLTGGDLSRPAQTGVPTIQVGPAAQQPQSPILVQQGPVVPQPQPQSPQPVAQAPQTSAPEASPPVVVAQQPPAQPVNTHPLQPLAMRHGEQLVPAGDNGTSPRPQPVPMGQMREYKAQSGDSLSKLASRFMGSSSKANRDAIVRVNPTLQQNPDKIVEGRTYIIPPAPEVAAAAPAQPQAPAPTPTPVAVRDSNPPPAPITTTGGENFTWYTVKENENLWKIASEQLGSGNAWTQIRDLNADILKGNDQLRMNTKIRIPNKPVASAAH